MILFRLQYDTVTTSVTVVDFVFCYYVYIHLLTLLLFLFLFSRNDIYVLCEYPILHILSFSFCN